MAARPALELGSLILTTAPGAWLFGSFDSLGESPPRHEHRAPIFQLYLQITPPLQSRVLKFLTPSPLLQSRLRSSPSLARSLGRSAVHYGRERRKYVAAGSTNAIPAFFRLLPTTRFLWKKPSAKKQGFWIELAIFKMPARARRQTVARFPQKKSLLP
jgi:hypothetical protein